MSSFDVFLNRAKSHIGLYKQNRDGTHLESAFNDLCVFIDNTPETEYTKKDLAEAYNLRGEIYAKSL